MDLENLNSRIGTSFRISIKRRAFETDPLGVVDPATSGKVQPQSSASNDAELKSSASKNDAEGDRSASNDAELFRKLSLKLPEKSRKKAVSILEEIVIEPHITGVQLGEKLEVSRATIQRLISEMKTAQILSRKGSNNGGVWVINKELDT